MNRKIHIIPFFVLCFVVSLNAQTVRSFGTTGYVKHSGIYGDIHVHDSAASQSIPSGVAYSKITLFADNGFFSNTTPDAANDIITITIPGRYRICGQASFSSDTANVTFFAGVFLAGVEQDQIHWSRKVGASGDVGSASFVGFVDVVSVPTDVDFRVRHDNAGSVGFTLQYGSLNVEYMGET